MYLLNAHLFPVDWAVRYSCPLLLALFPLTALLITKQLQNRVNAWPPGRINVTGLFMGIPVGCQLCIAGLFAPVSIARFHQSAQARTLLAYPLNQAVLNYNCYAFSNEEPLFLQKVQEMTDPGETILVWTALPFHLDFRRNKLLTISDPGLINPLLRFPTGAGDDALRRYLRAWGIRYVLFEESRRVQNIADLKEWAQTGDPVHRKIGGYNIYARTALIRLSDKSRALRRDESLLLFDIAAEPGSTEPALTRRH
jgi:hypothetical protein